MERIEAYQEWPPGLCGILEAGPGIGQEVIVFIEIVTQTTTRTGGRVPAFGIGDLMNDLRAELQLGQDLTGERPTAETIILRIAAAIDDAATAAEGRPLAPIMLEPNREQKRSMLFADFGRGTRQKGSREDGEVPAEITIV